MKKALFLFAIVAMFSLFTFPTTLPAQEVKIGIIYPLSGPVGQAGINNKSAIELALEIVQNPKYKNLNVPLQGQEAPQPEGSESERDLHGQSGQTRLGNE